MSDHRETHADYEQEEEAERVPSGIQDSDDKKESERGRPSAVFVDVAVVCELSEHLDDEKDDSAGNVVLHRAARDCQSMFIVPHVYKGLQEFSVVFGAKISPPTSEDEIYDAQSEIELKGVGKVGR